MNICLSKIGQEFFFQVVVDADGDEEDDDGEDDYDVFPTCF